MIVLVVSVSWLGDLDKVSGGDFFTANNIEFCGDFFINADGGSGVGDDDDVLVDAC